MNSYENFCKQQMNKVAGYGSALDFNKIKRPKSTSDWMLGAAGGLAPMAIASAPMFHALTPAFGLGALAAKAVDAKKRENAPDPNEIIEEPIGQGEGTAFSLGDYINASAKAPARTTYLAK